MADTPSTASQVSNPERVSNRPPREQVVTALSAVVIDHLAKLSGAALTLNQLSDQLGNEVADIEGILNKLNLGIPACVNAVTIDASDDGAYTHGLLLMYGKSGGKWGFLVDEYHENIQCPDVDSRESWAFKDAPREFRLKVVEKIPALLEALVKRSAEVASELTQKVKFTQELAAAITLSSPSDSKKQASK